jgi:hypothetical protein
VSWGLEGEMLFDMIDSILVFFLKKNRDSYYVNMWTFFSPIITNP